MKAQALLIALAFILPREARAQDIDIRGGGSIFAAQRTDSYNVRIGQTFTTSSTHYVLDSFAFDMYQNGEVTKFFGAIYGINASTWPGSWIPQAESGLELLWSSDLRTEQSGSWQETFLTGGLELEPEKVYFALIESELHGSTGTVWHGGTYAGGSATYMQTNPGWDYVNLFSYSNDLSFAADFREPQTPGGTVTPEPVTMILLGSGLTGIAAARRKRKTAAI